MDKDHGENIDLGSPSDGESDVKTIGTPQQAAENTFLEELLAVTEEIGEPVLESYDTMETGEFMDQLSMDGVEQPCVASPEVEPEFSDPLGMEQKLSYPPEVERACIGPVGIEIMDMESFKHEDQNFYGMLQRLEKLEDVEQTFQRCKQENFVKIWAQFSSLQQSFDDISGKIKVKINSLELAVAECYRRFEKENYDLKRRVEVLERKCVSQTNGKSSQNPTEQLTIASVQQKSESGENSDDEYKLHRETLKGIRDEGDVSSEAPPAIVFKLDPKETENTDEGRDQKDHAEQTSDESNQNTEDENKDEESDEEKKGEINIFEMLRQKTVYKWREFKAEGKTDKSIEREDQQQAKSPAHVTFELPQEETVQAEEEPSVATPSRSNHPEGESRGETGEHGEETESRPETCDNGEETKAGGEGKLGSESDEDKPDKQQDSKPKVNYFRIKFRKSHQAMKSSK